MNLYTLLFLLVAAPGIGIAQRSEVFTTKDGAIDGYDAVAYFTSGKPTKGLKSYSSQWNGATWFFSNRENKMLFDADPQRFAPQYGGYCAYGTAEGHKAPTQSDAWSIVNNKLYLNYDLDVRTKWSKNQSGYIEQADRNWPQVRASE